MQNERFKGMQTREMQLSGIRVLNEDDRTVELSFSSETPIERWGAFEVLSHTKSAVQLNRILTTGCLLYNHNRDTVIGKICSAKDRKSTRLNSSHNVISRMPSSA